MGADQGTTGRSDRLDRCGDKKIREHSRPGEGNVVATVEGRPIVAECKMGPLVHKARRTEQSLLKAALGQVLLFDVSADDIAVAAVPDTPVFCKFAETWWRRPLVKRAGVWIALMARASGDSGLAL